MDDNESLLSKELQKLQRINKPVPSWIDRLVNAGIVGGSESNIKRLREEVEPQHKSAVLIAKNKANGRKNVPEESELIKNN